MLNECMVCVFTGDKVCQQVGVGGGLGGAYKQQQQQRRNDDPLQDVKRRITSQERHTGTLLPAGKIPFHSNLTRKLPNAELKMAAAWNHTHTRMRKHVRIQTLCLILYPIKQTGDDNGLLVCVCVCYLISSDSLSENNSRGDRRGHAAHRL